jgi:hypothetical protein
MRGVTSAGETLKQENQSLLAGLDRLCSMFSAISPVLSLSTHHAVVTREAYSMEWDGFMYCSLKGSWMTALLLGEKAKRKRCDCLMALKELLLGAKGISVIGQHIICKLSSKLR